MRCLDSLLNRYLVVYSKFEREKQCFMTFDPPTDQKIDPALELQSKRIKLTPVTPDAHPKRISKWTKYLEGNYIPKY